MQADRIRPAIPEVLRFLGVDEDPSGDMTRAAEEAADTLVQTVQPRYVYRIFPVRTDASGVVLEGSGITLPGSLAGTMLSPCRRAVLLACTLGAGFETLLRAVEARDMARAVLLDACGSALVEAGCSRVERELAERFPQMYGSDRFSPGYGDLPLALQRPVCAVLDASRRLGVQVTESLLLNPAKSVTAIIGLADRPQPARIRGCAFCSLAGRCTLRKGGKSCAP